MNLNDIEKREVARAAARQIMSGLDCCLSAMYHPFFVLIVALHPITRDAFDGR